MTLRRIIMVNDYPTLKTWWERRGTPAPDPILLPTVGVVTEEKGAPVACAFLYEDVGGKVAMVEWEATSPDSTAMNSIRGLNMIFDFFENFAKSQGFAVVLSWVAQGRGDGRILERRKWIKCPGERHELMAYQCPQ